MPNWFVSVFSIFNMIELSGVLVHCGYHDGSVDCVYQLIFGYCERVEGLLLFFREFDYRPVVILGFELDPDGTIQVIDLLDAEVSSSLGHCGPSFCFGEDD